jgi:outer membrane receptor protein involved in Fe transport
LIRIDEVVVSASREQENKSETPTAISTIDAQQIEDNKPTTLDQVLNQETGVFMVDLGNEQHSMSIRQPLSTGATYLYLEDGIPIRASGVFNHNALLEINMADLSGVEIVRGPASSLYGSEAIGGAVNFITKQPSADLTAGVSAQGNNLGYRRSDFYVSDTYKKLGFRLSGYYANRRNGLLEHSDFNKLALSFKSVYTISDRSQLSWNTTFVDYYADMSGSLDSLRFFERQYESIQTFTNRDVQALRSSLNYKRFWKNDAKSTVSVFLRDNSIGQNPSYRVRDDFRPWIPAGNPNLAHGEINDNSFRSYGVIAQHSHQIKSIKTKLIGGASIDYSPNSYVANYIQINKNDDGIYDAFTKTDSLLADYQANLLNGALYLQSETKLKDNLILTMGARYDQFVYNFNNALDSNSYSGVEDSRDIFSRFTPKVGLNYNPLKSFGMYANFAQGYVPPQVGQMYQGVDVPEIGPASYNNYEVGVWYVINKKGKVELTYYRMDGTDEIISVQLDDGSRELRNAGKTRHQGFEYALYYPIIKDLTFRVNGTYAIHEFVEYIENEVDLGGNEMSGAPRNILNSQIIYKPRFLDGFRISAEYQWMGEYYMDDANTKKYDGFHVFNIRTGYEYKSFEFWLNVINATNQLYSNWARSSRWGDSYTLGEPINFNLGVGYRFGKK